MKRILLALVIVGLLWPSAREAEARVDVSIGFFYNNLRSGGNWIDVGGYGYCWQPSVAINDRSWRPYADGYWAYTNYGWTWVSYEDFGWATYHYGRWVRLRSRGWVWVPGREWAPAWVSWRTGGNYVGWAPLPPRRYGYGGEPIYEGRSIRGYVDLDYDIGPDYYNFVNIRYIGAPVLSRHIYAPTQNITYVNQTVNVTNITYNNSTVYNYGPDYNRMSAYSTQPIQRLTVERTESTDWNAAAQSGAVTKVEGNRLLVAAPARLETRSELTAPPQVAAKVEQPDVETGWAGVTNAAAKTQLQEKMKKEDRKSIPPPEMAPQNPAALSAASPVQEADAGANPAVAADEPAADRGNGRGRGQEKRDAAGAMQPPPAAGGEIAPGTTPAAAADPRGRGRGNRGQANDIRQPTGDAPADTPPTDTAGGEMAPADAPNADDNRRGRGNRGGRDVSPANPESEAPPVNAPESRAKENRGRGSQRAPRDADIVLPPQPQRPELDAAPAPQVQERGEGRGRQRDNRGADTVISQEPVRETAPPQAQEKEGNARGRGRQRDTREIAVPQEPVREVAPPQPQDADGNGRGRGRQRAERREAPEFARPPVEAPPQRVIPQQAPPPPEVQQERPERQRGGGRRQIEAPPQEAPPQGAPEGQPQGRPGKGEKKKKGGDDQSDDSE
jgi:hypothetical protein